MPAFLSHVVVLPCCSAYAAYIAGILINVVGFAGAIGTPVPIGATYIYNLNFFCGFVVASGVYYTLCKIWPVPATSDHWMEVDEDATERNQSLVYGTMGENSDEDRIDGSSVHERKTELPKGVV